MVSEEYSSSDPTEMPVGANSHLSIIPPLCNVQQGDGVKESQLEKPNWKRKQKSLISDASNWDRILPSVSSAETFSSAPINAVTRGGLFVDVASPKVGSSQRVAQKSDDPCNKHRLSSFSVKQEERHLSEQWDAKGLKSVKTLDPLHQENFNRKTVEKVESFSVGLERERLGEEAQMEQQPESIDMDMNDIEWETGTHEGAFITQRFAHLRAGSEIFSETSSNASSSNLLGSYDDLSTMMGRRDKNALHLGKVQFVNRNIEAVSAGRKASVLTEEEEQRTNQIINEDPKLVGGVWGDIESQNYLASVEQKHFAEIESRLQAMQAKTHLKCRKSWFTKDNNEINPAVDLAESRLPGDNPLQKGQPCELPLKGEEQRQRGHRSIVDSSISLPFAARKNNLMAVVTRPIHSWEIMEALKHAKQERLEVADRDELNALVLFVRQDLKMIMEKNTAEVAAAAAITTAAAKIGSELVPPLPPLCH